MQTIFRAETSLPVTFLYLTAPKLLMWSDSTLQTTAIRQFQNSLVLLQIV